MFDPVELARTSVYDFLSGGTVHTMPRETPSEFLRPGAAFVSLKIDGRLRGCIGTFMPTRLSLAEEIIHNAISAATRDFRFSPLTLAQFDRVKFSVDVLTPAEPVEDIDELDPKVFGVIVKAKGRQGLLLPDIEGVDSVREQISIAKQKAGIAPAEPVDLFRFQVTRYK